MKFLLPLLAASGVAIAIAAANASKIALPHIKGGYPAAATFEIVGENPDNAALATSVRGSRSGRRLKMSILGTADPTDTPVPVNVTLKFTDKGRVAATSFMMGYYGPTNTAPAKFKKKGSLLTFTLKSGTGGASIVGTPIEGSVSYQCRLSRNQLSITGSGFIRPLPAGTPLAYIVSIAGARQK